MKLNELMKSALSWAKSRNTPFTTAEAYENMKGVDDIKQLSDTLRNLYIGGHLARQKLDGFRYTYALASAGLEGFEIAQPEDTKGIEGINAALFPPRRKAARAAKVEPGETGTQPPPVLVPDARMHTAKVEPGETGTQPLQKTILAPAPGFPKFFREEFGQALAPAAASAPAEKQVDIDDPVGVIAGQFKDAPVQNPAIKASAPVDRYADIGRPTPQRVSYMIDDSGRLDIGDDDTLISLPAAEVKRLVAFLDRVSGLL